VDVDSVDCLSLSAALAASFFAFSLAAFSFSFCSFFFSKIDFGFSFSCFCLSYILTLTYFGISLMNGLI